MKILTACSKDGELIMLTSERKRSELREWRQSESFFCPRCRSPVQLKVGDIVIPHFAHQKKSDCSEAFSEGESPQHLNGKRLLYQLLHARVDGVILEPVIQEISQRPDLLVLSGNLQIPIEFQCSTIPLSLLQSRTEGFRRIDMIPIWILQTPPKLIHHPPGVGVFQVSKFQEWFITKTPPEGNVLLTFNPQTKTFHYFSNLMHVAGQRYIGIHHHLPIQFQRFPFARPKPPTPENLIAYAELYRSLRKDGLQQSVALNKRGIQNPFLRSCYEMRSIPTELPVWIGIPTIGNQAFREPDYEWQMRLLHFMKRRGSRLRHMSLSTIRQFVNGFSDPSAEKVEACQAYIQFLSNYMSDLLLMKTEFHEKEIVELISIRFLAKDVQN